MSRDEAKKLYTEGCRLEDEGDLEGAIACFSRAHALEPTHPGPPFALGVTNKWLLRFEDSLRYSELAASLATDEANDGAVWNIGIAATALGLHRRARRAWSRFVPGIEESDEPLALDLGLTPIRLDPKGAAEVVWCDRIDPARAIVRSVPLPDSGYGYGDLVLHDGEPRGRRKLGEQTVSVFDVLTRLAESDYSTYSFDAEADEASLDALRHVADERGLGFEEWSTSVRMLCAACSRGELHEHDEGAPAAATGTRRIAIAARTDEEVEGLLEAWHRAGGPAIDDVAVELDRRDAVRA